MRNKLTLKIVIIFDFRYFLGFQQKGAKYFNYLVRNISEHNLIQKKFLGQWLWLSW